MTSRDATHCALVKRLRDEAAAAEKCLGGQTFNDELAVVVSGILELAKLCSEAANALETIPSETPRISAEAVKLAQAVIEHQSWSPNVVNMLAQEIINAASQEPSGKSPGTVGNDGYEQKASRGAPVRDVPADAAPVSAPSATPMFPFEAIGLVIAIKDGEPLCRFEREIPAGEHILYITRKGKP